MKQFIILLFCSIILFSCKKEEQVISIQQEEEITENKPPTCAQTRFVKINLDVIDVHNRFMATFFLTEKDGFVTTYKGEIYKTTDSAKTWTLLDSVTNLPIRDIYFIDSQNGLVVGGESGCSGADCIIPGGFILRTEDAGQTWKRVHTPSKKLEINAIYFVNKLVGFCIGFNIIYKTTDGGKTWTENHIDDLRGRMMAIKFSDTQNGIIACIGAVDKIFKTTDGGQTWEVSSQNTNTGYYCISLVDNVVYVSGQGKILKSIDKGVSWNRLENSPSNNHEIHFITKDVGYAFTMGEYQGLYGGSPGAIYCTEDGGNSWNENESFRGLGFIREASFPSARIGYAIGLDKIVKIIVD